MKKCKKVVLSIVMTLSIVLASVVPFSVSALSDEFDDGAYKITYNLNFTGGVSITGYSGTLPSDFTIPDKLGGITVTEISSQAFANGQSGCGVKNLTIPGTVKTINMLAFAYDTLLESVTLNEGTTTLGMGSFFFSGITSLTIPSSVASLDGAFAMCQSLAEIILQPGNKDLVIVDGALCSADFKKIILYPAAKAQNSFVFPDTVTDMAYAAFSGAQIADITLSSALTEISDYAFYGNEKLKGINIPSSVTKVGERSFQCNNLGSISIMSKTATFSSNYTFVTAVSGFTIRGYAGSTAQSFAQNIIKVNFEELQEGTKSLTDSILVSSFASLYTTGGSTIACDYAGKTLDDNQYIGNGSTAKVYDKYGSLAANVSVNLDKDLNGDGLRNADDYNAIINDAMKISALLGGDTFRASADLNGDGAIDLFDASIYDLYLNPKS